MVDTNAAASAGHDDERAIEQKVEQIMEGPPPDKAPVSAHLPSQAEVAAKTVAAKELAEGQAEELAKVEAAEGSLAKSIGVPGPTASQDKPAVVTITKGGWRQRLKGFLHTK